MAKVAKVTKSTKKEAAPKAEKKSTKEVGKAVGVTSGLGVVAFWNKLLKANSKAKLTDAELEAAMKEEFPKRDYFQPVGRIRSWFNAGKYALGYEADEKLEKEDPRRSVGYDEDGKVVKRANPFQKKAESDEPGKVAKKKVVKKVAKKAAAAESTDE